MSIVKYLDKIRKAMTDPHKKLRTSIDEQIDKIKIPKDVKKQMHKDVKNCTDLKQLSEMQTATIYLANLTKPALPMGKK